MLLLAWALRRRAGTVRPVLWIVGGGILFAVTQNVLTVPATLNVPFGQTASMPVNIPQPAPAGLLIDLLDELTERNFAR